MTPPGQKVATIANAWRAWSNINGTRRRRYLVPAFFMAKTAARIFDVPGLKQSGDVVIGFIEAFKASRRLLAPKQNRMKAREQMDHIDQAIASVQAEVCATTQGDEESHKIYLYQAQQYVDTLERLKKKLAQEINKRSRARFADQWNIVETLETHEKQFLGARLEFLEARLKVYVSNVGSHLFTMTNNLCYAYIIEL
ncbi:hypothetical protein FRC11_013459 [Ceratobasidium sp. 423]|nr:hypothetical protein FRC11_013459 [Ceratobasidium sp. 423]